MSDTELAEALTHAPLQVLAPRISGDEARDLGVRLPSPFE